MSIRKSLDFNGSIREGLENLSTAAKGDLGATAFVIASNASTYLKEMATARKSKMGDLIQVCDGVQDNIEIQAALDACSPTFGGVVQLSEGIFNFRTGVTLATRRTIRGMGVHVTKIYMVNGANINLFTINEDTVSCRIEDMWIQGNEDNNASGNGIVLSDHAWRPTLNNLRLSGIPSSAITTTGDMTDGLYGIWMRNIHASCKGGHVVCLKRAHSGVHITDSGFGNGGVSTFLPYSALYLENCYGVSGKGIEVYGCLNGLYLGGSYPNYNRFNDIYVDSCKNYGVYLSNADFNQFSNLEIYAVGQDQGSGIGIGVANSTYNQFNNIAIHDNEGIRDNSPVGFVDTPTKQLIVESGTSNYNQYSSIAVKTKRALSSTFTGSHNRYWALGGAPVVSDLKNLVAQISEMAGSNPNLAVFGNPFSGAAITDYSSYAASVVIHLWFDAVFADDGGVFTDETAAAISTATNDVHPIPAAPTVDDAIYFGRANRFGMLSINLTTQGVGTWTITWEYYNGSAWTALAGVSDATTGWTAAAAWRTVSWTVPSDWASCEVNSATKYWIRARVSAFTAITTQPLVATVVITDAQDFQTPQVMRNLVPVLTFNGTNENLRIADANQYSFGDATNDSAFSLIVAGNVTNTAAIRGAIGKWCGVTREWELIVDASDKLRFDLWDESVDKNPYRLSDAAITMGSMKVFIGTYDGGGGATAADGIALYENGSAIASTATNDALYVAMENLTYPLFIGSSPTPTTDENSNPFAGTMSCIFIFPVALTAAQAWRITQLLNSALGI